jgi:hypothetical protein
MHNLRELTRVYGVPRRPEINVVLLPEMVTDKLDPSLQEFQGLLGVGVSPELLAATSPDDPAIQLYDWLGATGDFSPLAVVGVGPVNRALPEPDIPMAHELAHTYGLPHVQDAGNLLHQGSFECTLSLTDPQLERIRSALAGAAGRGPGIAALSLTNRAGDFVQAIRRRLTPER